MNFIDLHRQHDKIKQDLSHRLEKLHQHGRYINGPEINELELKLSEYTGSPYCIATSSGTDALLMALMVLDIAPGDEVITTPFTFVATGTMIKLLGAKPVFVDIDPDTYNINPNRIEEKITKKTKAIIAVGLYGQCAEMDTINAIAQKHNLTVIEDAAQSFGATYQGRRSCHLSSIACASFYPAKPLGCYGDGGACFTSDPTLAKKLTMIRNHGQDQIYHHEFLGINGRLDTMQAAILLAKLTIFPEEVLMRHQVAAKYTALLQDFVQTPIILSHNTSVFALYTIRVENREMIRQHLHAHNIPTAVHYPMPLHLQPVFADLHYHSGDFPHAEKAAREVLSIPMHAYLQDEEINNVVTFLKKASMQVTA